MISEEQRAHEGRAATLIGSRGAASGKGPSYAAWRAAVHVALVFIEVGPRTNGCDAAPPQTITIISVAHKGRVTATSDYSHTKIGVVSLTMSLEDPDQHEDALMIRLQVLELVVATIAARLPRKDMEEVASVLVFVANASDAASVLTTLADPAKPALVQHYAIEMLNRMTKVRRKPRSSRVPN